MLFILSFIYIERLVGSKLLDPNILLTTLRDNSEIKDLYCEQELVTFKTSDYFSFLMEKHKAFLSIKF